MKDEAEKQKRIRTYQKMAALGVATHAHLMTVGDCNPQVCVSDLKSMFYIKIEMPIGSTRADGHKIRHMLGVESVKTKWKDEKNRAHDFIADMTWEGMGDGFHVRMEFFKVCRIVGYKEETKQVPIYECNFERDENYDPDEPGRI